MTSSLGDQEYKVLLQRITQKNNDAQEALDALYKSLYPQIYSFVRQFLNYSHESDIDSIVVETMYEVWSSAAKFEGKSKLTTWVFGIARFKALDFVRANKKQQLLDNIDDYEAELES